MIVSYLPCSLLTVTGEILKLENAPSLCSGVSYLLNNCIRFMDATVNSFKPILVNKFNIHCHFSV